jgi:CHASE2 domain-containing sensor protein
MGLRRGDEVAYCLVQVPRDEVLQASTIDYTRIFSAGPEELRQLLADKIVLVADIREGKDRFGHPDGRLVPGCYGHAAGIDAILRMAMVEAPTGNATLGMNIVAVLVGLLIAAAVPDRTLIRIAILAAVVVLALLVSVMAYRVSMFLVIPVAQLFAVVATCELAAVAMRARLRHHRSRL